MYPRTFAPFSICKGSSVVVEVEGGVKGHTRDNIAWRKLEEEGGGANYTSMVQTVQWSWTILPPLGISKGGETNEVPTREKEVPLSQLASPLKRCTPKHAWSTSSQ